MRKHVEPVGFIVGEVAEFCISDFDDIDLHHAFWRRNPNTGRAGLCYTVMLQEYIELGRFSGDPAVGGLKITSGPVRRAEPARTARPPMTTALHPVLASSSGTAWTIASMDLPAKSTAGILATSSGGLSPVTTPGAMVAEAASLRESRGHVQDRVPDRGNEQWMRQWPRLIGECARLSVLANRINPLLANRGDRRDACCATTSTAHRSRSPRTWGRRLAFPAAAERAHRHLLAGPTEGDSRRPISSVTSAARHGRGRLRSRSIEPSRAVLVVSGRPGRPRSRHRTARGEQTADPPPGAGHNGNRPLGGDHSGRCRGDRARPALAHRVDVEGRWAAQIVEGQWPAGRAGRDVGRHLGFPILRSVVRMGPLDGSRSGLPEGRSLTSVSLSRTSGVR